MKKMIDTKLTDIINSNFLAVELFEKYELNYCLKGNSTLGSACSEFSLKPEKVINEFSNLSSGITGHFRMHEWDIDFLCDYIVKSHHGFIRKSFPSLIKLSRNLENKGSVIEGITGKLELMESDFSEHMNKEEKFLFPHIKKIRKHETGNSEYEIPPFGNISDPVKMMVREHEIAIENFGEIKSECSGFNIKGIKDPLKKEFYELFKEFEIDLHLHFHFENNLLFPKAVKAEKKLLKKYYQTNHL
ncbi:MAG: DUF542 domain-containing protein [Bacteroidetes bacterium]|nr:DUF542 domain-containing protein [Bacteroidota bacterium]